MKHQTILCLGALLLGLLPARGADRGLTKQPDPTIERISLGGYIGDRINLCIATRVMGQDADYLVEPFRHHEESHYWQTEFWGKWVQGAIASYRYNHDAALYDKIAASVKGMMAAQLPNGYLGNYAPEHQLKQWDVWGRKYTMLGLIAWYDLTGDKAALKSACRELDYLMTQVGPGKADIVKLGNYRGMAASSVLEPVVYLYNRTKNKAYLDFAQWIVAQWETPDGPHLLSRADVPVAKRFPLPKTSWFSYENGMKAYEMMSCYEGLLELYEVTGRQDYLEAVEKTVRHIIDEEINIAGSGSAFECWYGGKLKQTRPTCHTMETCVTYTWMRLLQRLNRTKPSSLLVDEIERSAYNALLASLKSDGSEMAKYSPLVGHRYPGSGQCGMTIHCCDANGPRGFAMLPSAVMVGGADGVTVDLYVPTEATLKVGKAPVGVSLATDYPLTGGVNITLSPKRATRFALKLRIPAWARFATVSVNGEPADSARTGSYYNLERTWQPGDRVTLNLDVAARLEQLNNCEAVVRGPIVLARDSRFADGFVDEAIDIPVAKDGTVDLQPAANTGFAWLSFTTKAWLGQSRDGVKPSVVHFCDFASAGSTWDAAARYRVWLPHVLDVRTAPGD